MTMQGREERGRVPKPSTLDRGRLALCKQPSLLPDGSPIPSPLPYSQDMLRTPALVFAAIKGLLLSELAVAPIPGPGSTSDP